MSGRSTPWCGTISPIAGARRCLAGAFFCSEAELLQWLCARSLQPIGCRLALGEALEVSRALFEPVLAVTTAPYTE